MSLIDDHNTQTDGIAAHRPRQLLDYAKAQGLGSWEMYDGDMNLKGLGFFHNLITRVGDQYYGERAAGIAGAPGQVTVMKLGTGTTAVAKTGAGAALVTYLSGTNVAIDSTWPQSSLVSSSRQIQWQTTFGPGVGTHAALAEVVLVNDVSADATSTSTNTIARALISPTQPKAAADTLIIVWNHLILGA